MKYEDDKATPEFSGESIGCSWCPMVDDAIKKGRCDRGDEHGFIGCGVTDNQKADCECKGFARDDTGQFLTEHSPRCSKYNPVADALKIIRALVKGVESWAHDCDGVHEDCWAAYKRGKMAIGEFDWKET